MQSRPWAMSALNRGLAVAVGKVLIWRGGMLKHQLRILEPRRVSRRSLQGCASSSVLRLSSPARGANACHLRRT
jgi:hypothetical protein